MIIEGGTVDDIHRLAVEQGMVDPASERTAQGPRGRDHPRGSAAGGRMSPVTPTTRIEWAGTAGPGAGRRRLRDRRQPQPLVDEASATGQSLASLLIGTGPGTPEVVVGTLSQLAQLPGHRPGRRPPEPDAAAGACRRSWPASYGAVGPTGSTGNALVVAFAEPPDAARRATPCAGSGRLRVVPGARPTRSLIDRIPASRGDGRADRVRRRREPEVPAAGRRTDRATEVEDLLDTGIPVTVGRRRCRCTSTTCCATRSSVGRLGPPPHGGHARHASGCTAPSGPSRAVRRSTTRRSAT